jgi:hypothetical protein
MKLPVEVRLERDNLLESNYVQNNVASSNRNNTTQLEDRVLQ